MLPWSNVPRVVVLDNASIHTSKVVRQARHGLAASGIYLYVIKADSGQKTTGQVVVIR